ncbi:hypothetical protein I7V27_13530 [Lelliottia amnigena]|uniref:Uncharacterized protein n=1 Tax=Lelliottia amnigena TaxID=61646 RepID=A0AAP2F2G6_LELAM|nr:hypothetical protein [Lelliottia amnigena]MBL5899946.1 hypothetical protein [Lelliottia amnigena]MBL5935460.1 hypothetical protein [Lelliottia amnigena]
MPYRHSGGQITNAPGAGNKKPRRMPGLGLKVLWWPVLNSGFSAYARQWQNMATGVQSLRISLRIHHNEKATHQSGICFNRP